MTKLSREELEELFKREGANLSQFSPQEQAERERRAIAYLDASQALADLMVEAGIDPDAPAPVCSCGRSLCRRATRNEEGHDMPL